MSEVSPVHVLLDRAEAAGLPVGLDVRQKALWLATELAGQSDPNAYFDYLRPILVKGAEDDAVYDRIVQSLTPAPAEPALEDSGAPEEPPPTARKQITDWAMARWGRVLGAAAAGLILLVGFVWWAMQPAATGPPTVQDGPATGTVTERIEDIPAAPEPLSDEDPVIIPDVAEFNPDAVASAIEQAFNRFDGAPTLRELHGAGLFGEMELAEAAALSGLPRDVPLLLDEGPVWRGLVRTLVQPYRSDPVSLPTLIASVKRPDRAAHPAQILASITVPVKTEYVLEGHERGVYSVSYSPDGAQIVSGSFDNSMRVWDAASGAELLKLEGHQGWVLSAAYSPDGARLVSGSSDGSVRVWDAATGAELLMLEGHESGVSPVAYSPDGAQIVSGSDDNTVRVWEAATGAELLKLDGHQDRVWSVAYSPDGAQIVSGSYDNTVRVWDAATGAELLKLEGHEDDVTSTAFSPDGAQIVSGSSDNTVRVWDAATGAELLKLEGHDLRVNSVAYSPDGAQIVSGSSDNTVRVWDTATTAELLKLEGHQDNVDSVAYSPDGAHIVSGSYDNTARVWGTDEKWTSPFAAERSDPWTRESLLDWVSETAGRRDIDLAALGDVVIVRHLAAHARRRGRVLHIIDPPWEIDPAHQMPARGWLMSNLFWVLPLLAFFSGLAAWAWSALRLQSFLQRRDRSNPGKIIDLFSQAHRDMTAFQAAISRAARALLQRGEGELALDVPATIRKTANNIGLFTPVERPKRCLREYLFLIDSNGRADHETRRARDYLRRLKDEGLAFAAYTYERAPDRVRPLSGGPSVPLADVALEHSNKHFIVMGDAASLLSPVTGDLGRWALALNAWQTKALLSTVPSKEWGMEERLMADLAGFAVRPFSADGIATLHGVLNDGAGSNRKISDDGALDQRPLPALIRRDPERWILDTPPDTEDLYQLLDELQVQLGIDGMRWLRACAIYPVVDWDLTLALGHALKSRDDEPIANEARLATLSELPWMREGDMPDWLRSALIEQIDAADAQAIKKLIEKILTQLVEAENSASEDMSLSFSYERGRAPENDERFVEFVTRAPKSDDDKSVEATQKLRDLLRPTLRKRALEPSTFSWGVLGALAALLVYVFAPRFDRLPMHAAPWLPLLGFVIAPLFGWAVWQLGARVKQGYEERAEPWLNPAWRQWRWLAFVTWFGFGRYAARQLRAPDGEYPSETVNGIAALLRRRVVVYMMPLWILIGGGTVAALLIGSAALFVSQAQAWTSALSPLRGWAWGDTILTALILAVFGAILVAFAYLVRWTWRVINDSGEEITTLVQGEPEILPKQKPSVFWRLGSVFTIFAISAFVFWTFFGVPDEESLASTVPFVLCVLSLVLLPAFHALTLRRFAQEVTNPSTPKSFTDTALSEEKLAELAELKEEIADLKREMKSI